MEAKQNICILSTLRNILNKTTLQKNCALNSFRPFSFFIARLQVHLLGPFPLPLLFRLLQQLWG